MRLLGIYKYRYELAVAVIIVLLASFLTWLFRDVEYTVDTNKDDVILYGPIKDTLMEFPVKTCNGVLIYDDVEKKFFCNTVINIIDWDDTVICREKADNSIFCTAKEK